jgi:hypothetical protein
MKAAAFLPKRGRFICRSGQQVTAPRQAARKQTKAEGCSPKRSRRLPTKARQIYLPQRAASNSAASSGENTTNGRWL